MSMSHNRSSKSIARTAVVVTTTGFAALALAGPVLAETAKAVLSEGWSVDCSGGKPMGDCDLVERSFSNTVDKVKISVTQGNSYCAQSIAEIYVDGQNHPSRRIGTWQQEPLTITVPPGHHQIKLNLRTLGNCKDGVPPVMTGNLLVEELVPDAPVVPAQGVAVTADTDIYDKPSDQGGQPIRGADGEKLFLTAGVDVVVPVGACTKETWCTVRIPRVAYTYTTFAVWGGNLDVPES